MNFILYPQKGHKPSIKALQASSQTQRSPEARKRRGLHYQPLKLADCGPSPTTCQWIEGEPRDRMFCNAPVKESSSYCPEHHARCYITVLTEG